MFVFSPRVFPTARRLSLFVLLIGFGLLLSAASPADASLNSDDVYVALSDGGRFVGTGVRWHDYFCTQQEVCKVGDVNGDGLADIIAFVRTNNGVNDSDVYVALSTGTSFGPGQKWHDYFCTLQEICDVADVNGDGKADIVAFVRTNGGAGDSDVWVALSNGTGFGAGQKWHDYFCTQQEVCAVGDVNGDGKADILAFVRTNGGVNDADVYVALSDGTRFGSGQKWHDYFCIQQEVCKVGDVNGDGKADIITFVRTSGGINDSDVYVAFSDGTRFGVGQKWHDYFCTLQEICDVGDVNGDGRADAIAFVRTNNGVNDSNVYVALSTGTSFGDGQIWHDYFCTLQEICAVGDANGDGKADVLAFVRTILDVPTGPRPPEFLRDHPDLRLYYSSMGRVIIGGGYLYWSSCPVSSPAAAASSLDEAPGDEGARPAGLATVGYLARWPTGGGRVVTLTDSFDCAINSWAADDSGLYYAEGGFIRRRSAADPTTAAYVMFAQNASTPYGDLLLDAQHVYWYAQSGWLHRAPKGLSIDPTDPRYRDEREDVGFIGTGANSVTLTNTAIYWFRANSLFNFLKTCGGECTPTNLGAEAGGKNLVNAELTGAGLGDSVYPLWLQGSSLRGRWCRPGNLGFTCSFTSEYTAPPAGGNVYKLGGLRTDGTYLFWVENYEICAGISCVASVDGQLMRWRLDRATDPEPIAARDSGGARYYIRNFGEGLQVDRGWVYFYTSEGLARRRVDAPPVQPDLAVYAIEVTQGIQNLTVVGEPAKQMDVPLVAFKPTTVRVYGQHVSGPRANNVTARLRVDRNFGPPVSIDFRPDSGSLAFPLPAGAAFPDRNQMNQSWQFTLPYAWTRPGDFTLTAIVNADRVAAESNPANNQTTTRIHFTRKAPICIVFIPIKTAVAGDIFAPPLRGLLDFSVAHAERLLPVERIMAGWRQSQLEELELRFGIPPWEWGPFELDEGIDPEKVLVALFTRDQLSDDPDECDNANARTHYVGVAHPNAPSKLNGKGRNGGDQMLFLLPSTATWTDQRAVTLAHELGHNYDRDHVNCPEGDPDDPDPNYPFPRCQIDLNNDQFRHWGLFNNGGTLQPVQPTSVGDLMSYAHKAPISLPRWTSSYTWHGIFHALPDGQPAAKDRSSLLASRALLAAPSAVLLTGLIDTAQPTNSQLDHAWVFPTAAVSQRMVEKWARSAVPAWVKTAKTVAPDYHIRLFDAAGAVLDDRAIALMDSSDSGAVRGFSLTFPAPTGDVARLALLDGETVLAEQRVGPSAPAITLLEPSGGETIDREMTLRWTATDADPGDRLLFTVQYSPDNGQTWRAVLTGIPNVSGTDTLTVNLRDARNLPASTAGGLIRVAASDGYHTSFAVSPPFTVPNRAPEPVITAPTASDSLPAGGTVLLEGNATDAEEGGLDPAGLVWTITGPGGITITGSGASLPLPGLAPGVYTVTLEAQDATGAVGSTTINFTIAPLAIPTVSATVAPALDGVCDDDAYAGATRLPLKPYADGTQALALLVRTDAHLWACFTGLQRANGGSAGSSAVLRADPNNSRDSAPQPDDYEFALSEAGVGVTRRGDGVAFAQPGPDGLDGRVTAADATWEAELRLDAAILGGWGGAALAVAHASLTPADGYAWPHLSRPTSPATWASTALVALPRLTAIAPLSVTVGAPAFTLTVEGENFAPGAIVRWNDSPRPTTVIDATRLQAAIEAADLVSAGTAQVTVSNPDLATVSSNGLQVTIFNPAPSVTAVTLASQTLTVEGSDFVSGATVAWNGVEQPTAVIDSTRLQATIDPALIPLAGRVTVVAQNPVPSVGPSNVLSLQVGAPSRPEYRLFLPHLASRASRADAPALIVYDDALASRWENWSWDASVDLGATSPVHSGSRAVGVALNAAWAGLSLRAPAPINPAPYTAVSFWAYGTGSDHRLEFYIQTTDDGSPSPTVAVTVPSGVWTRVTIPLSSVGQPSAIARLTWQDASGAAQPALYLDDIRLVAAP